MDPAATIRRRPAPRMNERPVSRSICRATSCSCLGPGGASYHPFILSGAAFGALAHDAFDAIQAFLARVHNAVDPDVDDVPEFGFTDRTGT